MKKTITIFFLVLLTGFLNARIMHIVGTADQNLNLLTGVCSFFLSSLLVFSGTKAQYPKERLRVYIALSVSLIIWDISIRLLEGGWKSSVFSLPRLPCELAAIFFAYQCFSKKLIPIATGFLTLICTVFICIRYMNPMAYHYSNYGITNPKEQTVAPQDWHIVYNDSVLHNNYSKGRYVILDFWSKNCAVCYKKFPLLDSLYQLYEGCSDIEIISVLVQNDGDTSDKAKKIVSEMYHFPVAKGGDAVKKLFHILSFPTVLIIYDGEIIYKGSIEGVDDVLPEKTRKR